MKTEKERSIMLPGKSYDLYHIENCFEEKMEKEPTRSCGSEEDGEKVVGLDE